MVKAVSYNKSLKNAQTTEELYRLFYKQLKKSIKVQIPVEITSVDYAKNSCDVKALIKETDDNGNVLPVDIFPNVPIRHTNETSTAYIRVPVQVGDTGTVEFFDCSISKYRLDNIVEYHFDEDYHTLESPLYTSGFYSEANVFQLADVNNTAIEIGTKSGTFILNVDKTTGALTITAPSATITAPAINLTGAVTINGGLLVTGLITGQSNISTSGTITTTSTMSCSDILVNSKNVDGHVHLAGTPPGNTGAF